MRLYSKLSCTYSKLWHPYPKLWCPYPKHRGSYPKLWRQLPIGGPILSVDQASAVGAARADHCNYGTVDGRTGQLDEILYCSV